MQDIIGWDILAIRVSPERRKQRFIRLRSWRDKQRIESHPGHALDDHGTTAFSSENG